MPYYGPRRVVNPSVDFDREFVDDIQRFLVSKSEMKNYRAICKLANFRYEHSYALQFGKVHCTFKTLGESLKPGGEDNLLKHLDGASEDTLRRAFRRSKKARPLHKSDLLKSKTTYLYSSTHYTKDDEYHKHIPHFQVNRDRYVEFYADEDPVDMRFDEYKVIYPNAPRQNNMIDCDIFLMMFLEHWVSPRIVMSSIFTTEDIPRIRVKIANELMFLPSNIGLKRLVLSFDEKDAN